MSVNITLGIYTNGSQEARTGIVKTSFHLRATLRARNTLDSPHNSQALSNIRRSLI